MASEISSGRDNYCPCHCLSCRVSPRACIHAGSLAYNSHTSFVQSTAKVAASLIHGNTAPVGDVTSAV